MAISTYQTYLMKGTGTPLTYAKLIDIKTRPSLLDPPERLETTTMSNAMRTYIPGLQETSEMTFQFNYTKSDFSTLQALEGTELDLAIYFGADSSNAPDGHEGKFTFKGYIHVSVEEGAVNEVVNGLISIYPTTDIAFA